MTQEAKQRALEPCPFCGGEAKLSNPSSTTYGRFFYSVGCPKCPDVEMFDRDEFHHTEDGKYLLKYPEMECVDRWNTRVSQPATPEGWKTTVWQAWRLLNEIRARDGTAYQDTKYQMYRQEYRTHDDFNQLVEDMRAILGEDAQPWPPSAAAPVQEEM